MNGSDNHQYRGIRQSSDGVIVKLLKSDGKTLRFLASFGLTDSLIARFRENPENIVFSERSRIARLGIQISAQRLMPDCIQGNQAVIAFGASSVINDYPDISEVSDFFSPGLPVGRLVYCDPTALLTSDEVMAAIESSVLKLPASTTISSDGRILIAPHKVVFHLRNRLDRQTLGAILLRKDGRERLNRFQIPHDVAAVVIAPGKGVITTCSMYLNDHYVMLQSGHKLGKHLPATVLDPIKTRGVRIYLEIVNDSAHPIVNPLISAGIYRASASETKAHFLRVRAESQSEYQRLRLLEKKMDDVPSDTCLFLKKPAALFSTGADGFETVEIRMNGPENKCTATEAECTMSRRNFSPKSYCPHVYATAALKPGNENGGKAVAIKYFPNSLEHRDIITLVGKGGIHSLYFFEPSRENGPFLSQADHSRLEEYHAFGLKVYWVSALNQRLMIHTMRDGKGYFVIPERLADFHKSMLFAFYGSNRELSDKGINRMGLLMDMLISFWGGHIGIVTGGGSGVMENANAVARRRGILSGANFLDITDQTLTTDVDFCQVFQSKCRHSRQKWFEVASFPIFNVGGLGTLEELGITLCNMKLSIVEPVPIVLFDTEGDGDFWASMLNQIRRMVSDGRAPEWVMDNLVITDDPATVTNTYRKRLQLF